MENKRLLLGLGLLLLLAFTNPSAESFYYYVVNKSSERKQCIKSSREINGLLFSIYETKGVSGSGVYLGILGNYVFLSGMNVSEIKYCPVPRRRSRGGGIRVM